MNRDEILSELRMSLHEMFDIDPATITPSASLRDDLDLDSIDAIDLAVRLKKLLGRRVELAVLKELVTVEDVVNLIANETTAAAVSSGSAEDVRPVATSSGAEGN